MSEAGRVRGSNPSAGPSEHRPVGSTGQSEHWPVGSTGPSEHRPVGSTGPSEPGCGDGPIVGSATGPFPHPTDTDRPIPAPNRHRPAHSRTQPTPTGPFPHPTDTDRPISAPNRHRPVSAAGRNCPETATKLPGGGHENCPLRSWDLPDTTSSASPRSAVEAPSSGAMSGAEALLSPRDLVTASGQISCPPLGRSPWPLTDRPISAPSRRRPTLSRAPPGPSIRAVGRVDIDRPTDRPTQRCRW